MRKTPLAPVKQWGNACFARVTDSGSLSSLKVRGDKATILSKGTLKGPHRLPSCLHQLSYPPPAANPAPSHLLTPAYSPLTQPGCLPVQACSAPHAHWVFACLPAYYPSPLGSLLCLIGMNFPWWCPSHGCVLLLTVDISECTREEQDRLMGPAGGQHSCQHHHFLGFLSLAACVGLEAAAHGSDSPTK